MNSLSGPQLSVELHLICTMPCKGTMYHNFTSICQFLCKIGKSVTPVDNNYAFERKGSLCSYVCKVMQIKKTKQFNDNIFIYKLVLDN